MRPQFIRQATKPTVQPQTRPVIKCVPPPNYHQFTLNTFEDYELHKYMKQPLFVTLKNTTLGNIIVKSKHKPTTETIRLIREKSGTIQHYHSITNPEDSSSKTKNHSTPLQQPQMCHLSTHGNINVFQKYSNRTDF